MEIKIYTKNEDLQGIVHHIMSFIPHKIIDNPELADYIIFPENVPGEFPQSIADKLMQFEFLSAEHIKKLIIFMVVDFIDPLPGFKNSIVYRTSMLKSRSLHYERLLPYLWIDSASYPFEPILNSKPVISFCGAMTHPQRVLELDCLKTFCGHLLDCTFIYRNKSWGEGVENARLEFTQNMAKSEFVACPRGCGNFSIRFYETLAAGRIPVFVNTDMSLPFENEINWHEHAVISDSVKEMPAAIERFIKTNDLLEVQKKCRKVYEDFLTIEKFCKRLQQSMLTGNF